MQTSQLNLSVPCEHAEQREDAGKMPNLTNSLSNAGNSMTSCEMPSAEPLWKQKEASLARLGGGESSGKCSGGFRCLELCCFGGAQPYSRGELQEKLWECFWGLSGIYPEFVRKVQPYSGYGLKSEMSASTENKATQPHPTKLKKSPLGPPVGWRWSDYCLTRWVGWLDKSHFERLPRRRSRWTIYAWYGSTPQTASQTSALVFLVIVASAVHASNRQQGAIPPQTSPLDKSTL